MLAFPALEAIVERAVARAHQVGDLAALKDYVRGSSPDEINSEKEKNERRAFLESLYRNRTEADQTFERIINGNELQDANFLSRGALVARTVMRVVLRGPGGRTLGYGSGFLIGDGLLLTNNHVLPDRDIAAMAEVEAHFERDLFGRDQTPWRFATDPSLFYTSKALDFTVVALAPRDIGGEHPISALGWLPLIGGTGKVTEGEWLTIIQHPAGERKQLCVRENQLIKRDTDVLWYSTDTLAGSSGSPVFNNDWLLVALHHSGVPETKNGKWQTIDGRDYDPSRDSEQQIKWVANEGIRVSRIVETLSSDSKVKDNPRIKDAIATHAEDMRGKLPVLFAGGVAPISSIVAAALSSSHQKEVNSLPPAEKEKQMPRQITVTLEVDDNGQVTIANARPSQESFSAANEADKAKGEVVDAPVEEKTDWVNGYDPKFLDESEGSKNKAVWVHLPTLSADNQKKVAKLLDKSVYDRPKPSKAEAEAGVLKYLSYSVVMNAERRLAFYSAANIDGGHDFKELSRPSDRWLSDDRIDRNHQLPKSFYVNNKLDRGHLTRREDLEWGSNKVIATRRANGTCTMPNCAPQHEDFNQDKDFPGKQAALWAGLEDYILEQTARAHQFKVQSITGPVFSDDDMSYRGAKIPMQFWKVVAAIDADGNLFATAYILSQLFVMERDKANLEEAAQAVPFAKFETYQVRIEDIEDATGLAFTYGDPANPLRLADVDPFKTEQAKPAWKRRKRTARSGVQESTLAGASSSVDGALSTFDDIILP